MIAEKLHDLSDVFTEQNLLSAWEHVAIKHSCAGIDDCAVKAAIRHCRPGLSRFKAKWPVLKFDCARRLRCGLSGS